MPHPKYKEVVNYDQLVHHGRARVDLQIEAILDLQYPHELRYMLNMLSHCWLSDLYYHHPPALSFKPPPLLYQPFPSVTKWYYLS